MNFFEAYIKKDSTLSLMDFYKIEHAFEAKYVGCFPQSELLGCKQEQVHDNSIFNVEKNKLPNFTPLLDCFIINDQAIITDFISSASISFGFLISRKVKDILLNFDLGKHAFFPAVLVHRQKRLEDYYWFVYEPLPLLPKIDFEKSQFFFVNLKWDKIADIEINSEEEYRTALRTKPVGHYLTSDSIHLDSSIQELDMFRSPISNYGIYFSSSVVREFISTGVTGALLT